MTVLLLKAAFNFWKGWKNSFIQGRSQIRGVLSSLPGTSVLVMKYNLTLWSTSLKPAERNGTRGWPFALYWLKGECSWRIWNSLLATSDLMYHLYHINFSACPRNGHVSKWIFISCAYMLNFSTSQPFQKLLKFTFWVNVKIYLTLNS